MELKEYLKVIEKFVSDYLENTHMKQYVLGLSGGVDSSLVAAICKNAVGKDKLTCIMIPIDSNPDDLEDALELAHDLDLNYIVIDGSIHNGTADILLPSVQVVSKIGSSGISAIIDILIYGHPEALLHFGQRPIRHFDGFKTTFETFA